MEPCVTGDDEFRSALLRWQAAVLRIVGDRIARDGVRQVFVDWQLSGVEDEWRLGSLVVDPAP